MLNFIKHGEGFNISPLLTFLNDNQYLWDINTIRQDYEGSSHPDSQCIFIRGPKEFTKHEYQDTINAKTYDAPPELQKIVATLLENVSEVLEFKKIGYVLIVKLLAGGEVFRHTDEVKYAEFYRRFHLVVSSESGNLFTVDEETRAFSPGELWEFNHRKPHHVINYSNEDRIHVIFDLK